LPGVYIPPHHPAQPQGQQTQMGIWWPAADSAKLRTAAQAWRDMARALDAVDSASQAAVLNVLADNQGPAMDAFAAYWQKWHGGTGYLPTCSQACISMGKALDDYAQAVDTARVKVEELVAEIATAVVIGVVLGVCTVGIATAAAGGVTVTLIASAEAVGVTLTWTAASIVSGVLVGATFGAVEAMAIDIVAIQPEKILLFHDQKDFDWNQVWQWGEMGAAGGFVGGGFGAGFNALRRGWAAADSGVSVVGDSAGVVGDTAGVAPASVSAAGDSAGAAGAEFADAGSAAPTVLRLSYKSTWNAAQRSAADAKATAMNHMDDLVVTQVERRGNLQSAFRKLANLDDTQDADHIKELQLSGQDEMDNMWGLDKSVNRSMGRQIQAEIARQGLKVGDRVDTIVFEEWPQ
jgi:hypothetical protein